MKVKITCTQEGLLAGLEYDLPAEVAMMLIEEDKAVPVEEKKEEKKKVKHDNGQNDTK